MVELSCSFPSPLNRTCWETAHNSYHFSHLAGTKSAVQNTSRMLFVMWRDTDLSPGPCLRLTEACPESARPEERQKLKRRAMSRRICIGQLVWDCAQQPPRAAKVTAIAPERPDPFLIRHLDAPKRPSDFKVHDEVLVDGRHGVCIWDGRPDHHFGRVRWEDGTESDVIHVERIRPAEDAYIEDTWAYDDQLEALDIKHLLQPSVTEARSSADVPGPRLDVPDVPVEVLIRRSSRSNKLAPQQVAWSLLPGRPPWPVKLISSIEGFDGGSSSRQWNVKLLGTDQEETVLASRLSPFLSGDALALGKIAQEAEAEHQQVQNTDGTAAAVAAAAAPLLAPLSGEKVLAVELPDDEDDALIVYEGGAGDEAQCTAPPGPVLVKDLVEEIGHDVSEEVIQRSLSALEAEGVVQTRQLLQLYPQDFDAVAMPLLLKSRLRRVRERGGKIPEDLIGHKKQQEEPEPEPSEAHEGGGLRGAWCWTHDPHRHEIQWMWSQAVQ
ncbi:unnamed protein product [Durusdinium trenchii]|uniref:Uncharacterized protein n=1 Tax=Durusdinium trenchii TaxID=1381693 RepID=A0ABP0JIY1_9DINO